MTIFGSHSHHSSIEKSIAKGIYDLVSSDPSANYSLILLLRSVSSQAETLSFSVCASYFPTILGLPELLPQNSWRLSSLRYCEVQDENPTVSVGGGPTSSLPGSFLLPSDGKKDVSLEGH